MKDNLSGHIYESATRYGPLINARLGITQENTGKLVTMVRKKARIMAVKESADNNRADSLRYPRYEKGT